MKMRMENELAVQIVESWAATDGVNSTESIVEWVERKNESGDVRIRKVAHDYGSDDFWRYDSKELGICNQAGSFFKIAGLRFSDGHYVREQPIIIQDEIGYLGIIGKVIDGVLHFLMQAKVEPGNVNKYQISPTIQATKSNFMRAHGGKEPAYLQYFSHKENHTVVCDQIQSEQSSRFLGKRNRNIIIVVDCEVEMLDSHRWMTLGQIKQLMKRDNLVNMDTRTVLSCIPFALRDYSYRELSHMADLFTDDALYNSVFFGHAGQEIGRVFQFVNDMKMMSDRRVDLVDLKTLRGWAFERGEFARDGADFKIVYCDIEVEGREVRRWGQPLLEALGSSVFGLMTRVDDRGVRRFLVQAKAEVGCFDYVELAPSVQKEPSEPGASNPVEELFFENLGSGQGVVFRGLFSEEGGRFYHEQNWNVLMDVTSSGLVDLPDGYFWLDFQTLNVLVGFNNCLNIQLRNLLSLLPL